MRPQAVPRDCPHQNFSLLEMKHPLTQMQAKVVRLISLGSTTRQVACILGISTSTADNHRWQAMRKLEVHTMAGLTRTAIEAGITSLSDRLTPEELTKAFLGCRLDDSQDVRPPTDVDQSKEAKTDD